MTNLHFAPGVSLIPLWIHTRGRICKNIHRVATNCKSSYSSIPLHRIKYPLLPASIRYSYNVSEYRGLPIFQLRNFSLNNSSEDKKTEEVEKPKDESISWKDKSIYWSKEYQTIPNYITMSRILASPLLTYTVMYDMKISALVGVALFGFTDWLDGFLAKKLNQQTTIGAFLDPLADKIMIGSLSLGLMFKGLLPMELGVLIISRDAFLMVFSIVLRLIDKPSESGFWDVRSATFKVIPNEMSKINTAVQFGLLSLTLSNFAMGYPAIEVIEPFWWITATTTLWSWAAYLDGSGVSYFNLKEKAKRKAKEMMKSTR